MTSTPTILDVLREITTVQAGLTATLDEGTVDEETFDVSAAYPFFQDTGKVAQAAGNRFWRNEWSLLPQERHSALTVERYVVHMQFVVAHANLARAAEIATGFMQPAIDAFDAQDGEGHGGVTLGGLVQQQTLRGGNPTLVRFDGAERTFYGLDLYLDIEIKRSKELS